jgi:hypothetical protein
MKYLEAINGSILLDSAAKIASIFGLLLTIYAIYKISEIRRSFLQRARLPALQRDLRKQVEDLNRALREYDRSRHRVLEDLSLCSSTLRGISRISTGTTKSLVNSAQRMIKKYRRDQSEANAREIYVTLRELEEELKNLEADILWR